MKKLLIVFRMLIIVLTSGLINAQTNVSGFISSNTTWTTGGSPYIVTGNITILSGQILTVESDVVVQFQDNTGMYVYGTLQATSAQFTSDKDTPQRGDWNFIQIGDGWSYSGTADFTSCVIRYGGTNSYPSNNCEVSILSGSATFDACDVSFSSNSGISIGGGSLSASVSLTNTSIYSCEWPVTYGGPGALTFTGWNGLTGNVHDGIDFRFWELNQTMTLAIAPIPYVFPYNNFTIRDTGVLTIASGNTIKMGDGTSIVVEGSLIAEASSGDQILFTAYTDDNSGGDTNGDGMTTAPASGSWYGVMFQNSSNDANCLMRRCQLRYAGASNIGGISMFDASPTIDLCEISNCYFGVYMQFASNPVFTNNTIGSSQMTPIAMSFEANPSMSNNTLSFSDNAYDAIGLIGGTLTKNATLKIRSVTNIPNITYLLLDQIIVPSGKSLTINKGIVIKAYSEYAYYYFRRIIVEGTLTANATADSMISFTSARDDNFGNPADCNKDGTMTSPVVADWGGIIFNPGATGTLNYCRIKYAAVLNYGFTTCSTTEYLNEAAVAMIDASPTISNCEFKDLSYGISCHRASNPVISNNKMINIQYTPFCISGSSNPTFSGIVFTNIGWQAIGLLGGNVCQNGTIKKRNIAGFTNITYVLLADMTINSGTYINVEPGVVIKVNNCNMYVEGGFKTDGILSQRVVFTSIKDDNEGNPFDSNGDGNASTPENGNWGSVKYRSTSDDGYCLLNYTAFKYAGNTGEGAVTFENAGGQLKNSSITNTSNYGVYCNGNSTPAIDNVSIQNCSLDPIAISLTSNPTFTNITFISNFSQAIKIIEGTLSSNATLVSRNVAGINNIAYIVDKLIIATNAKITIQPNVVIKFRSDSWPWGSSAYILINGNLIAKGTVNNKIYFTSFADDSKGGDSNNNGNTSMPVKGDWGQDYYYYDQYGAWKNGGIFFSNNSINADTVNYLKNCEISYSGIGLRIENSHVTIDSSIIQLSNYYGATILGSANPEFKNSQFYNITYSPIELSMFSNPTFTNCTALNVGYMALSVVPETYSQTDTVPVRNFGGYNNINYFMSGVCTINSGTTITIPAGVVFKSTSAIGFTVNGRLDIQGTSGSPVVFTNDKDDSYGNPLDMNQDGSASLPPNGSSSTWSGSWIEFNDVSNDLSSVNNAVFKYGDKGIATLSASPTIAYTAFENLYFGVDMNGVSAPKIDNCTFHDLQYYPMQISLISYPASTTNNTISGTTYKVIAVREETLTQDVTLAKRNFGGITNIPYYFHHYTIGTGATLTIKPGIVCKFWDYGYSPYYPPYYYEYYAGRLDIFKGLSAIGGPTPDSIIVFTSIRDDFYGGDSNSDRTATFASSGRWCGLIFWDQSLDPLCKLKNCIIRFADKGIQTISASPTIENCNINNNNYGVYATAASNPAFSNCDFVTNYYFAINNVDKSFIIDAPNCWWGSNFGPIQSETEGDGSSIQELVSDAVNYTPWKASGAGNPVMGDVSLNGSVQAYDASLILKYVVNPLGTDSLLTLQRQVADVSGNGGPDATAITAYDASLVLQYVVGLIECFPANIDKSSGKNEAILDLFALQKNVSVNVELGTVAATFGEKIIIPVIIQNASQLMALQAILKYDPSIITVEKIAAADVASTAAWASSISDKGEIRFALASEKPLCSSGTIVEITITVSDNVKGNVHTALQLVQVLANEQDITSKVASADIAISGKPMTYELSLNYPNPFNPSTTIAYQLPEDGTLVRLTIYNMLGQIERTLVNTKQNAGSYQTVWDGKNDVGFAVPSGVYIYQLVSGDFVKARKLMLIR
ncbi:right-handed parallel beta-helix repeat-containing protein [bacterium]|nr:right-handed parallel beta-helix repeat-containing protein [bacterium]MBU1633741.1 right-handed parallel beta-helix repeat-containing protein [bacterium]MBU1874361.1 right-handed parallel beta-helix repeat-containing protein [bacterium]